MHSSLAVLESKVIGRLVMAETDVEPNFDVPPDLAAEARAIAGAEALESWGTADELPCPVPKQR